jgi:hypothetical protein
MGHVMNGPGRQQLCKGNGSEGRMASAALEVFRLQIHRAESIKILGAQSRELIQQLSQRLALTLSFLG